jgi:hypothetical protein
MGVFANSRSIVHGGDGQVNTAAPPDVCKTPSPGGPVPIPYVNIAKDSDLAKGTKKVKIEGNPVGLESSNLSTSSGDEPGTAGGGVVSSKFTGKMTWGSTSSDVKAEGKGVARFMDVTQHNGNSCNTVFTEMGGTGLAYGDDFTEPCLICNKGPEEHRVIELTSWQQRAFLLRDELTRVDTARQPTTPGGASLPNRPARSGEGYMVGTMLCQGGKKRCFAAMSGPHRTGFTECANTMGYTPIVSGPVSADEMMRANPRFNPTSSGFAARRAAFMGRWNELRESAGMVPPAPRQQGYNRPGQCAAAKLLAKSEHMPLTITEFFWNPTTHVPAWSESYNVLTTNRPAGTYVPTWRALLLKNMAAQTQTTPFQAGGSVASCHTCQRILYMMLCKKEERICC